MRVSIALAVVLLAAGGVLSYLGLKNHAHSETAVQHG